MVGDGGFEPPTSAVWRQRSPPELIALKIEMFHFNENSMIRQGDEFRKMYILEVFDLNEVL